MKKYVIALDQGTTSSRAIAFNANGKPVASKNVEFRQIFPKPGWVEHDPEDIYKSQMEALESMMKETGIKAIVEDGVAKLPDRSAFAGSVATADTCIKTWVNMAGVNIVEAVEMMTATPAKIMKVYDKAGSLTTGKYADIVLMDDKLDVRMTMIGGRIIFED